MNFTKFQRTALPQNSPLVSASRGRSSDFLRLNYKLLFSSKFHWNSSSNTKHVKFFFFNFHCVKSVRIRSYSGPYFPAFGLNTERHSRSVSLVLRIFLDFLKFSCCKQLVSSQITDDVRKFLFLTYSNRLFNNCVKYISIRISASWNMKGGGSVK